MRIQTSNVGSVVFIELTGRFVLGEEETLKDTVNRMLSKGARKFVLNLEEVTFMDTSGLSAMIAVRLAIQRRDGEVRLLNLPPRVHDLLVLTRLITLFDIVESENEAFVSLGAAVS